MKEIFSRFWTLLLPLVFAILFGYTVAQAAQAADNTIRIPEDWLWKALAGLCASLAAGTYWGVLRRLQSLEVDQKDMLERLAHIEGSMGIARGAER